MPDLYKWLTPNRTTTYTCVRWPVRARQWTSPKTPELCKSGWHLATLAGLSKHLPTKFPAVLWTAEGRGATDSAIDKVAFESARILAPVGTLTERTAHALACDFAEHVLPIWEARYPGDDRPRVAIETKRRWLAGEASDEERYAAYTAAYTVAYADTAAYAAADAAGAYAAAADAAHGVEREWQGRRILEVLGE